MADFREAILARLLVIAQGVDGIKEAARNSPDVSSIKQRPAIILHDGHEELDQSSGRPDMSGRIQFQDLNPQFNILFSSNTKDIGTVANLFRQRLIAAIYGDAELTNFLAHDNHRNPRIYYVGCSLIPPDVSEARETRLEVELIFTYPWRVDDLT